MSVVTTWLINSLMMAAVLTAGAAALELASRWTGRPARWGWLTALAGSVVLPWVLWLVPGRLLPETVPVGVPMFSLDPLAVSALASEQATWTSSELALVLWAATSLVMLAWVGRLVGQLARARRDWREAEVDGVSVYVTRNTGPAALGLRRGMVVIPSWALELDAELRTLLLQHEREHVRAGDPRLLVAGLVLVAAMPWNPLVWFQLLRLRHAMELDCDGRVLAGGADPARYGSLLLEVGRRRGGSALVMATFAEPRMFLHERIARIARWPVERRPVRATAFTVLALLLFATALNARDPLRSGLLGTAADTPAAAERLASEPRDGLPTFDAPVMVRDTPRAIDVPDAAIAVPVMVSDTPPATGPRYIPRTVEPEFRNREEIQRALIRAYPPMLRDAGIGGRATVWFHIDETGAVQRMLLSQSSGYAQLDAAALDVASVMRFSPAMNRTQAVAVWVELPITFNTRGETAERGITVTGRRAVAARDAETREVEARAAAARAQAAQRIEERAVEERAAERRQPAAGPYYVPRTVEPELQNRAEIQRALVRNYPPMLRDAGIGGRATVWFLIDETGRVMERRLSQSSGYDQLDLAAMSVAEIMRFSPAMNRTQPVAVWIELPITFAAR